MASVRTWHTYLGILIAPSVIFFALTGAVQLFSLHEAHGSYQPPAILEKLASVHKDQVLAKHEHHGPREAPPPEAGPDSSAPPAAAPKAQDEPAFATMLLKWIFLVVALALTTSTVLGLWIGLTHVRNKRLGGWLLGVGCLLPGVVVFLA